MSNSLQLKSPKSRRSNGLTAIFVRQKKAPGRYGDGNGLYLVADPSGAARWVLRVMCDGKRRDIGLGGAATVSLAEARDKAHELRKLAKQGEIQSQLDARSGTAWRLSNSARALFTKTGNRRGATANTPISG